MANNDLATLQKSYQDAQKYPCNLLQSGMFANTLSSYANRLEMQKRNMFCEPASAALDMLERREHSTDFEPRLVQGLHALHDTLLPNGYLKPSPDPPFRAFFLQAPDSQSSLSITWDMFAHLLTFLQAMPELLDFAFQFGHTIQPRDTHFSGFRSRAFLNHSDKGLQLPAFGRSGLGFQQCYNLKSVEPYPGRPSHPWSIRATAIYHSFDVASGSITWVTIKGSALIKHRLTDAVQQSHVKSTSPTAQSFALSLLGHLVMCEWANEHWRSYINSLDDKLHDISKPILNARVARDPPNQGPDIRVWRQVRRTTNMLFDDSTSPNRIRSFLKRALANRNTLPEDKQNSRDMQALPDESRPRNTSRPEARFEFKDVQKLAVIEERAAEARRVLRCNVDTLKALQNMYQTIWEHKNFPHEIKAESEAAMDSFHTRTASTVEDMNRHSLNLDNILHVLEVRRNVLTNMFTHQSIHESQQQARKAQETADNMQDMTQIMGRIARRTEQETVVMKIITVVTLCFLPATFICTFLSTDVIQYSDNNEDGPPRRVFSSDALALFLKLCLPLMSGTLFVSWLCHRWIKDRMDKRYRNIEERISTAEYQA